jgi:integrase
MSMARTDAHGDGEAIDAELVDPANDDDSTTLPATRDADRWREKLLDLFEAWARPERSGWSQHTRRAYRRDIVVALDGDEGHEVDGLGPFIDQWDEDGVVGYKADLFAGYSDATAKRRLTALRSFLGYIVDRPDVALAHNPAANVSGRVSRADDDEDERTERERERLARETYCPTRGEMARLIAAARHTRNTMLLRVTYRCGLRATEALRLRWSQLRPHSDGEHGVATIHGKGDKARDVVVPVELWGDLVEWRPEGAGADDHVFPSREGGAMTRQNFERIIKSTARRADLEAADKLTPHCIRHAFATHAYKTGEVGPRELQEQLGHASLETTATYLHIDTDVCPGDHF